MGIQFLLLPSEKGKKLTSVKQAFKIAKDVQALYSGILAKNKATKIVLF